MITKNNWLTTNITNRLNDSSCDFDIKINPYPFKKMDFQSAVDYTVGEITSKYSNLYLGLTGGYDSDFIMHAFCDRKVPITPIIVKCNSEEENAYAYKTCEKYNINPVILNVTEEQLMDAFKTHIHTSINSSAHNGAHNIIISQYVLDNKGTLLLGHNLLGNGDDLITEDTFAQSSEWDFYWEALFPELNYIDFYLYTIDLTYSIFPFNDIGTMWKDYKSKLYSLEKRDKMKSKWSADSLSTMDDLRKQRTKFPKSMIKYSLNDIQYTFDKFIII